MSPTQVASITCPVCRNPLTVPFESIIDVDRQPELRARFLQGQLNSFRCPSCGNVGAMSSPLLYHDGAKQLILCLTPATMSMQGQDTQKIIGSLTNALISSLPPEKRKAYLFQPKVFLTMESMVQAVLEADGITKEMMEAQKAKVALLERLLAAKGDQAQLKAIVAENKPLFDYEFFQILTTLAEVSQAQNQTAAVQELMQLRQALLPLTKVGREVLESEKQLREEIRETKADLLRRVAETQDSEELEGLVRAGRPYMDYEFFQELTGRIESASPEESKRLSERRAQILAISERQDEEAKQLLTERADLLKRSLQAEDPEALLREEVAKLDEAFFTILSANAQQAARSRQNQAVKVLQQIGNKAMQIVRENAPPVIKLINQLMEADYPEATLQIMKDNRDLLNEQFYEMLDMLAEEMESQGQASVAERLDKIGEQAQALAG